MARAAQRDVVHDPVRVGAKAQHVDGLGAEERHARRRRARRCRRRSALRRCARTRSRTSVTPAAGDRQVHPGVGVEHVSLVVSKANSSVWPVVAFDSAETLATNSMLPDSASEFGELGQLGGVRAGALGGEVDVLVGAQRLDQVDLHLEGQRPDALVGVDQRRVVEMLGPHADDHVGGAGCCASMSCTGWVSVTSPNGSRSPDVGQRRREEVHRRRPDEARDEQVRRAGCTARRACRSAAPRRRA